MVALAAVLACGLGIGFARGGSLRNLSRARLRWIPAAFVALALQVGAEFVPRDASEAAFGLIVGSYGVLFAWAGFNWRLRGMALIALGALLNFTVILANGGMPVSAEAAARAGYHGAEAHAILLRGKHFLDATGDVRLRLLSDVIPLWRAPAVASVGDLVLWAGLIVLIQQLMVGGGVHTPSPASQAAATRAR